MEERKQLELLYEKNFADELLTLPKGIKERDPSFIQFQFEVFLRKGSISLLRSNLKSEKIFYLEYKGMSCTIKKRENNKEIFFRLQEMEINFQEKNEGNIVFFQNFFCRNEFDCDAKKKDFFNFSFEEKPLGDVKEEEVKPDYSVDIRMASNKVVYDPIAIKWLRKFWDIQIEDRDIVEKTLQGIDKINENYQVQLIFYIKTHFF